MRLGFNPRARLSPGPEMKGATMAREGERLTKTQLTTLSGGWEDIAPPEPEEGWEIEREDLDLHASTVDLWTYTIGRMKLDLLSHLRRARNAHEPTKGWRIFREKSIINQLTMLRAERGFLEEVFPLLCVFLGVGPDAERKIHEELSPLIEEAEDAWHVVLRDIWGYE